MKDKFRAITLEWIKKAKSDYGYVISSFREFDDFYSQMCILSHDAAEKFFKGFIAAAKGRDWQEGQRPNPHIYY